MDLKTPISLLQEYLVKEGVLPFYNLVYNGGGTHDPVFHYEVTAKGVSEIGKGRSKKEAKQDAAKLLLLRLKGAEIWKDEVPIVSPHIPSVKGNSIGALQEYCVQHCISSPQYEFVSDDGEQHADRFVVKCTVSSVSGIGKASSKQQAKHVAAQQVLSVLKNDHKDKISEITQNVVKEKDALAAKACKKTMEAFEKTLHERQDRVHTSSNTMRDLFNFADHFKSKISHVSSALEFIKNKDEELLENHGNPNDLLDMILKQLGYSVMFEFLNTKSPDSYLCNLNIKELGINCIGHAKGQDVAKRNAIINALKVFVVMSKS